VVSPDPIKLPCVPLSPKEGLDGLYMEIKMSYLLPIKGRQW
jgi:hypothetical protein